MSEDMDLQILTADKEQPDSALKTFFNKNYNKIIGLLAISIFLALWEYVGTSGMINPLFTSSPSRIYTAALKIIDSGIIYKHLRISSIEYAWGFGLAVTIGIPIGIMTGWYRNFNATVDPFISFLYATPSIAFMSLIIIWFGIGVWSKVAVIFLSGFFVITINTQSGIRMLDTHLLKAARSFGAKDKDIFVTVALPSAVPFILAGLRLAVGRCLVGVVVGEMYAATAGIGYMITTAGATFQTDLVFVGVAIVAGCGWVFTELLKMMERRFDAWRPSSQHSK